MSIFVVFDYCSVEFLITFSLFVGCLCVGNYWNFSGSACKYNSNLLIKTINKGTRPRTGVSSVQFFPRTEIVERLKRILQPDENQPHYYLICGEYGTGKTTLVRTASSYVDHGIIYVDIPARIEDLGIAFGQALNFAFEERISFTNQLIRKLGNTNDSDEPMWYRALKAFKHGAKVYKAKCGRPAVIVYDNVNRGEGAVPRRMECKISIILAFEGNNMTHNKSATLARKNQTEKRMISEKTEELYELVGGRSLELKDVADDFLFGLSFEDIKKKKLKETRKEFDSAKLLENQKHYKAGKCAINALLKSKEIDIDVFRKLFANEEEYNEILGANVFAYHPSRDTVGFQSKLIECYIQGNSDIFVDLINLTPTNEFNSNYASTSKS
ncbi:hypothetical protein Glove_22g87 [Diversispora epigaea]|uniref:ATPase AAA-type core domain-containing protein n=1 Tax=Diversispora epigaea TaxID=1348612 RepID=A0A397JKW4_9GLOM|nr:hypothetical protein Glove_22g87 [Diversispora epigaea]